MNKRDMVGRDLNKHHAPYSRQSGFGSSLLIGLGMVSVSGAGLGLLSDLGPTSLIYKITTVVIALLLVLVFGRSILSAWIAVPLYPILLLWSAITLVWTKDLAASTQTLIGIISLAVIAASMVQVGIARAKSILVWTFSLTSCVSLVLFAVAPSLVSITVNHPVDGLKLQLNGIFPWNSDLGFTAGTGLLVAVSLFLKSRTIGNFIAIAANAGALLAADSVASILSALGAAMLIAIMHMKPWMIFPAVGIGTAVIADAFLYGNPLDTILRKFGRDGGMTGRSTLWRIGLEQSGQHPFSGAGIGTAPIFTPYVGRDYGHVHNSFIQMLYERGIIGLAILVVLLIVTGVSLTKSHRWVLLAVLAYVTIASMANQYLTAVSLGFLLFSWTVLQARSPLRNACSTPDEDNTTQLHTANTPRKYRSR